MVAYIIPLCEHIKVILYWWITFTFTLVFAIVDNTVTSIFRQMPLNTFETISVGQCHRCGESPDCTVGIFTTLIDISKMPASEVALIILSSHNVEISSSLILAFIFCVLINLLTSINQTGEK